jgi:hypothetical protein
MKKLVLIGLVMFGIMALSFNAVADDEEYMTDSGEVGDVVDGQVMTDSGEMEDVDDDGEYMTDSGEISSVSDDL